MTTGYEVRVEGELGEPLLRFLSWSHGVMPEQTCVRVNATPAELGALLRACSENGLIIERVRRIDSARPCPRDESSPPDPTADTWRTVSRGRARDPDGPHRHAD